MTCCRLAGVILFLYAFYFTVISQQTGREVVAGGFGAWWARAWAWWASALLTGGPPDRSAHPALQQSKPGSSAQVTGPNVVGRERVMADVRASEAHGPVDVPLVAAGWDRQPGRGLKHL